MTALHLFGPSPSYYDPPEPPDREEEETFTAADLRSCLNDLVRLRDEYEELRLRSPISVEARVQWRGMLARTRLEVERLEQAANGMLREVRA